MPSDLINRIRTAQIRAAEQAVIDSIPLDLKRHMDEAQARFEAEGGCKGCGSKVLAVHYGNCPTLDEPDFY